MRGSTPADAQPITRASGAIPSAAALARAHQHHRRTAVGDPGRRPGGDDAAREHWRKLFESVERRVGARMLVGLDQRQLAFAVGDRHGGELAREPPLGDRLAGAPLRLEGVGVRRLTGDAVLARELLPRLAHDLPRQRAGEAVTIHGIDEREVAHAMPPARIFCIDQVWHPAHRLDAAGDDNLRVAEHDGLCARRDRLHPRRTRLVDGVGGNRIGQPRAPPDLPRWIGTRARLPGMPDQHFVNLRPVDTRSLERSPHRDRAEFRRMDGAKRAAIPPDGRPCRAHDHYVGSHGGIISGFGRIRIRGSGSGFRVRGFGASGSGFGFRVRGSGSGFGLRGSGFGESGFRLRAASGSRLSGFGTRATPGTRTSLNLHPEPGTRNLEPQLSFHPR